MPKRDKQQAYHCDGFYFNNVCKYRGEIGLETNPLCTHFGLDEKNRLCPHCIENKGLFPKNQVKMRVSAPNGRVISLTPFQAKDASAKTVRAFMKPKDLAEFLKTRPDLYGVDVRTGELIGVEVV